LAVRVIAGMAKGTKLTPVPEGTRPVSDRAREGLFSSLGHRVAGARVLDLYAGTGAMGIEALSRGAEHATFVDHATGAIRAIRDNLAKTRLAEQAEVVRTEVRRFLGGPEREFDVVFLDPPYAVSGVDLEMALVGVSGGWLASDDGVVALTRPAKTSMPVIPVNWQVARRLSYGDTQILLFREA
jgi:16S rRNA (guanine966-N2)-methyltransferase